jgi:hypothetical protein
MRYQLLAVAMTLCAGSLALVAQRPLTDVGPDLPDPSRSADHLALPIRPSANHLHPDSQLRMPCLVFEANELRLVLEGP